MMHYIYQNEIYILVCDPASKATEDLGLNQHCIGDNIAVVYEKLEDNRFLLHKHGCPKICGQWLTDFIKSPLFSHHGQVFMIEGKLPIEEVNKAIHNTNYIYSLWKTSV